MIETCKYGAWKFKSTHEQISKWLLFKEGDLEFQEIGFEK
jgi:hypothetical protein